MNFPHSTYTHTTTHRPHNSSSHFNEDAHCDNEVNLILEKNNNQHLIEQAAAAEKLLYKEATSAAGQQTNQYYFMPIREQTSTTALAENNGVDNSLLLLSSDFHHPSTLNLFDESSSNYFSSTLSAMNPSDTATVNKVNHHNNNYHLTDADLAALFVSSIVSTTTPSPPLLSSSTTATATTLDHLNNNNNNNNNSHHEPATTSLDDVFLTQLTDLACCSPTSSSSMLDKQQSLGPPPGFENFHFDPLSTSDRLLSPTTNNPSISSISTTAAIETPVSPSDTINFSQLLPSALVDLHQQQAPIVGHVGNVRSSSSSHSSFTSDEQSIFFPMSTHPYSSSSSSSILHANSQMFSTNTPPSLSTATTTTSLAAKPHIPSSLSLNNHHHHHHHHQQFSPSSSTVSRMASSTTDSPSLRTIMDNDASRTDGDMTTHSLFASPNSFFSNGHADFPVYKTANSKPPSANRQSSVAARTSSSSASSSTSSSIDEALIQLTQQQQHQQLHNVANVNKLFNDEPISIFNFGTAPPKANIDKQQQAVHDNINFLASMATASTPSTPDAAWHQPTALHPVASSDSNIYSQRKMRPMMFPNHQQQHHQQQHAMPPAAASSSLRTNSTNMHELLQNLNELCYKGFDELNALIQEQRWVQSYVSLNASSNPSPCSPSMNANGLTGTASRVLIVSDYFIFKCKKVEISASHVYELLALARPELRLRDLMTVFKSWKEAISNAEKIHQKEENKLRLSTEHPHSYYMTDAVLQAAFDRVSYAIRQLGNMTQQARVAFQYATLNVFQASSRQQPPQAAASNLSQSSTSVELAHFQAMQQQKATSISRASGSNRTTP